MTSRWLVWVCGLAAWAVAAGCSDGGETRSAETATATGSPTAATDEPTRTGSPPAVATPVIRTLESRPAIPPPKNSHLFIVSGCTQCDGPDETLQRHDTDSAGSTTVTTVMGPGHEALDGMTVGQIDAAADGTVLAVAVCPDEYCGGVGQRAEPTTWRVLVSVNDGEDWTVAWEGQANYAFLEDVTVAGVIVGEVLPDGSVPSPRRLTLVNLAGQQRVLTPPAAAGEFAKAALLASGSVAWIGYTGQRGRPTTTSTGVLREDGTEIPLILPAAGINDLDGLIDGTLVVAQISGRRLISTHSSAGTPRAVFDIGELQWNGIDPSEGVFGVASDFGPSAMFTSLPVLVDLVAGTATPLVTDALAAQAGRNRFIAYSSR
jgi:hypothetical protein